MSPKLPNLIRLPISHYCRKVEWALNHAGIAYTTTDVWFRELVEFQHVNPENTVPVLELDGQLLCGSARIMQWISDQRTDLDLYPKGAREGEAWADQVLGPLARHDAYRTLYAHPTRYTRNPLVWLIARAGRPVILAILKAYQVRRHEAEDAKNRVPALDKVAAQLRAAGTGYLLADHPTAMDFATAALLHPLLPIRDGDYKGYPDRKLLQAYVRAVKQKPRYRQKRRRAKASDHERWTALPKIV